MTRRGLQLTFGGELPGVPFDPVGHQRSLATVGPAKLEAAIAWRCARLASRISSSLGSIWPRSAYPLQDPLHLLYRQG